MVICAVCRNSLTNITEIRQFAYGYFEGRLNTTHNIFYSILIYSIIKMIVLNTFGERQLTIHSSQMSRFGSVHQTMKIYKIDIPITVIRCFFFTWNTLITTFFAIVRLEHSGPYLPTSMELNVKSLQVSCIFIARNFFNLRIKMSKIYGKIFPHLIKKNIVASDSIKQFRCKTRTFCFRIKLAILTTSTDEGWKKQQTIGP